jgi:hypothetical protein
MKEQGHIPALDTMDGLTDIFALLAITFLLSIIDYREYPGSSAPAPLREKEEIRLAQLDAFILVKFFDETIDLADDGTGEPLSVEDTFFSYFILQGRWLLQQLKPATHIQQEEVRGRLSAAEFFWGKDVPEVLKGDVWKEEPGEATYCFESLNQALKIRFPTSTQENMKRKSIQNTTSDPKKRRLEGVSRGSTSHLK